MAEEQGNRSIDREKAFQHSKVEEAKAEIGTFLGGAFYGIGISVSQNTERELAEGIWRILRRNGIV